MFHDTSVREIKHHPRNANYRHPLSPKSKVEAPMPQQRKQLSDERYHLCEGELARVLVHQLWIRGEGRT